MTNKTSVFVYGTLKKGNNIRGLDKLDSNAEFVGEAETVHHDYYLYDLGAFPAVTKGGIKRIKGEVWEVSNDTLTEQLDAIEGYPEFYTRSQIDTTAGKAWIYHIEDITQYNCEYVTAPIGRAVEWNK